MEPGGNFKASETGKYTGDVILGKTHVAEDTQVKSQDISKQVLMRAHHPTIISHELLNTVQREKNKRSKNRAASR